MKIETVAVTTFAIAVLSLACLVGMRAEEVANAACEVGSPCDFDGASCQAEFKKTVVCDDGTYMLATCTPGDTCEVYLAFCQDGYGHYQMCLQPLECNVEWMCREDETRYIWD
jgi:hypothetical protein